VLADVTFHDPTPPLLANADARPLPTASAARAELVEHLTTGVDWVAVVGAMATRGVDTFLEIGPGRVLTGLIKRIAPGAAAIQVDDPDEGGLAPAAVHLTARSSASPEPALSSRSGA
jgi:[acyl-carrier-protein] S-malonyltransferase